MKRFKIVVLSLVTLLVCACATPTAPQPSTNQVNQNYIDTVEHRARRSGVRVQWINPPRDDAGVSENG